MTMKINEIGNRAKSKKATFTIENKLLEDLKTISKRNKKKMSPIVNDLIRVYIEQQQSLL